MEQDMHLIISYLMSVTWEDGWWHSGLGALYGPLLLHMLLLLVHHTGVNALGHSWNLNSSVTEGFKMYNVCTPVKWKEGWWHSSCVHCIVMPLFKYDVCTSVTWKDGWWQSSYIQCGYYPHLRYMKGAQQFT